MENKRLISLVFIGLSIISILAFFVFNFPFPFLFLFFPPLLFRAGRGKQKQFEQNMQMNYCSGCGNKLNPIWSFCPNCSKPIEK